MPHVANVKKRERYPHTTPRFMSDFIAILNAEIIESGRIPDAKVIERTKQVAEMLEDYFSDRNTMTPIVNPQSDMISFKSEEGEIGFIFYITLRKDDQTVEDELVVWDKLNSHYVTIRGIVTQEDLDYLFN